MWLRSSRGLNSFFPIKGWPNTTGPAARPPHRTAAHGSQAGATAPTPHASASMSARPAPLQAGARSTRRGLRVGVPDSLRRSFVWGAQLMDCPSRRTAPAPRTTVRGCCGLTLTVDHVAVTQLLFNGDGGYWCQLLQFSGGGRLGDPLSKGPASRPLDL